MNKERKSNFELLRILSMFLIVMFHTICHGGALSNSKHETLSLVLNFLVLISLVHVNSYILTTGYFQSKKEFKQARVWSLINSNLFYRIIILIILTLTGYVSLSKLDILKEIFIINITEYWFIRVYLYLYCLSPFLNKLISSLDKKMFKKLLMILFVILSILPFITGNLAFDNDGFTLYQFIFLYLLGAYFREYPIEKSYLFKHWSKEMIRLICICVFIGCVILNFLLTQTSLFMLGKNEIIDFISINFIDSSLAYSNPIVIIQTLAYFFYFSTLDFKSKFINKVSSLSLGVYLIHDNQLLKSKFGLYKFLGIGTKPIYSFSYIFYIFIVMAGIFVGGLLIEWIRQIIFKFIYNRKISKKIRDKYYNWLNNLKAFS